MSQNEIHVMKADGRLELQDNEKIHRVITWAAEGLKNVSVSQVEMKAALQFYDGIPTREIHECLITSASDLIDVDTPDYQYLAARLSVLLLRKTAYGQNTPPSLEEHVKSMVGRGWYDEMFLEHYTSEDFARYDALIDHDLDYGYTHVAMEQFKSKYLVKNRKTKEILETPQFLYILMPMALYAKRTPEERDEKISEFYKAVSLKDFSLPTPIMAGLRTPTRQFASCVLVESGDSLKSINATTSVITEYVSKRAGIGIGFGRMRAEGSSIRNGEAVHSGVTPFLHYFQKAVGCCSQGGLRNGSATAYAPAWHREIEEILVLKNNRGTEENRVRHMDYGIQMNRLFYRRIQKREDISLFSPNDVPGLYEAFSEDQALFEELYAKYEADESIERRTINGKAFGELLANERAGTGRIYVQNIDHTNTHSPFIEKIAPVRMSNLCIEIALPTKPLINVEDPNGEIALCTLSAFNLGRVRSYEDFLRVGRVIISALDALLDYQDYLLPAAERATMRRRTLGVGVVNYAYALAKLGYKYGDQDALNETHRVFERMQHALMTASMELAKQHGPCPAFHETKMSKGILPIDTYHKPVDKLVTVGLELDWEPLRADILKYGMRNSTVSALMPSETSSQILNATNGIEPPRGALSIKASKDGQLRQLVPDVENLQHAYDYSWDHKGNGGVLKGAGVMQKFVDQMISVNTYYDPSRYETGMVPQGEVIMDVLTAYTYGIKGLYYHNTRKVSLENNEIILHDEPEIAEADCGGGGCKI